MGQAESDEQAAAAELAALEHQLLEVPAEDVIANHCYGLFQLAALHLGQHPPNLEPARLAIDALGAIVQGLGDRLGEASPTLQDGLAQIRLAFVQLAQATNEGAGPLGGDVTPPRPAGASDGKEASA